MPVFICYGRFFAGSSIVNKIQDHETKKTR
nr:MAG TPA: hypothetical protein [Caudoviricetes sp.]